MASICSRAPGTAPPRRRSPALSSRQTDRPARARAAAAPSRPPCPAASRRRRARRLRPRRARRTRGTPRSPPPRRGSWRRTPPPRAPRRPARCAPVRDALARCDGSCPASRATPRAPRLRRVRARRTRQGRDVRVRRRVAQRNGRAPASAPRARARGSLGGGRRACRAPPRRRTPRARRPRGRGASSRSARARAARGRCARRRGCAACLARGVREVARRLARSRRKRMALVGFYVGTSSAARARR